MPNYTFMTPELQALLQAIDNAKQQQPQTPADYVTDQTRQGIESNKAADIQQQQAQAQAQMQQLQAQMPQQEPLLNPTTKAILDQLVNYKDMYENADAVTKAANPKVTDAAQLGAAADSLRLSSHKAADEIRQLAASLGVDLTGYENVGYEDAAKKLQSRQAKELMDITTGQGEYGRNSERYFNDQYRILTSQGYSPRMARRVAGERAQVYQDDRVTYLRNAYNMYGRDGNYTNEDGVSIIEEIASEMPQVAQVYANAYGLPIAAQGRAEQLEDKVLDQTNLFSRLDKVFEQNKDLADLANKHTLEQIGARGKIEESLIGVRSEEERRTISHTQAALFERFQKENKLSGEQAKQAWWDKVDAFDALAVRMGLKGDDRNSFVAAGAGINIRFGKDGKPVGKVSDDSVKSAKDMLTVLMSHRNSILSQMEKEGGGMINYEDNPELYRKLALVDERIEELTSMGIEGITGTESKGKGDNTFTGNWHHDSKIIEDFRADAQSKGYSWQQIKQMVYKQLVAAGYSEENAKQAAGLN